MGAWQARRGGLRATAYTGLTDGLTEDGLLRVRTADGTVRIVRHGGVREASLA